MHFQPLPSLKPTAQILQIFLVTWLIAPEKAWRWALDNPNVIFRNNDASFNSEGLGAGQQEFSNDQLQMQWLSTAIYLFAATGKSEYKNYVATTTPTQQ